MVECLNCGADITRLRYCAACGQRTAVTHLTWRDLTRDIREQLLEGNLPWLRTLRQLVLDPGGVSSRFIAGQRVAYVHPLKYAFYTVLIFTVVATASGGTSGEWAKELPFWRRVLVTNLPLYLLLITPVAALCLRVAFFKLTRNFVETWVFVLYMLGQLSLLFVAIELVHMALRSLGLTGEVTYLVLGIASLLLPVTYYMAGVAQFYGTRLYWALLGALLSLMLTTFVGYVIYGLLAGLPLPMR